MEFSKSTKEHLGYYVYALVDPRDKTIFYVGKLQTIVLLNYLQSNRTYLKSKKKSSKFAMAK